MFTHVLAPIDIRFRTRTTLATAAALAEEHGAALTMLYVQDLGRDIASALFTAITEEQVEEIERGAARSLRDAAAVVEEYGVIADVRIVRGSPVHGVIHQYAISLNADLIVMGTHGRAGLAHAWWGSVTEEVIRSSRIPVLVVHEAARAPRRRTITPSES